MSAIVYKIFLQSEWETFEQNGVFNGTPLDIKDGYIHLSTKSQAVATARLHFENKGPLALAEFNADNFSDTLKYEPARDGSLFPHQYGPLLRSQVKRHWLLKDCADGAYEFPKEFF